MTGLATDAASIKTAKMASEAAEPRLLIRSVAVLGAGTMGSRIAAHLANCGIPVLMLDVASGEEPKWRNKLALAALDGLLNARPAAYYEPSAASLITVGNFEDDLPKLESYDWILEAVTEDLGLKVSLLSRVLPHLSPTAILTTNTSGLPVSQIAASLVEQFGGDAFTPEMRRRWFGTHFFNPPRYMRLLEVISTSETDPAVVSIFAAFADRILGKEVVAARDTPNFIANRIGVVTCSLPSGSRSVKA